MEEEEEKEEDPRSDGGRREREEGEASRRKSNRDNHDAREDYDAGGHGDGAAAAIRVLPLPCDAAADVTVAGVLLPSGVAYRPAVAGRDSPSHRTSTTFFPFFLNEKVLFPFPLCFSLKHTLNDTK